MAIYHGSKVKIFLGSQKIKKGYLGAAKIYSSGNSVTYMVDSAIYKTAELDEGDNVLNAVPNPSKSGYTFIGWSRSNSSGNILSSLLMGEDPIVLYAVYLPNTNSDLISNKNYVNSSNGALNYQDNTAFGTGVESQRSGNYTIYINLNRYKKATVKLNINNSRGSGDLEAKLYVNGSLYKSYTDTVNITETIVLNNATNTIRFQYNMQKSTSWHAGNSVDVTITGVTFSM